MLQEYKISRCIFALSLPQAAFYISLDAICRSTDPRQRRYSFEHRIKG
jgi:hypothetical protein